MKNIVLPDYNNSILNITTTILEYYNINTGKSTIKELEEELKKGYRNIVYILIDAMGSEILKKHPKEADYMLKNKKRTLTTVFPSTTVAATISALTGKPPINTGWIGWLQYIKEEDKSVIFFFNKDFYDETVKFDYNVSEKFAPVTKIYEQINKANKDINTFEVFPEFRVPEHKSFRDLLNTVIKDCNTEGENFIYAYWDKLDTYLHKTGTESVKVKNHIEEINEDLKYLSKSVDDDTLIIVTADHGQLDIEEIELWKYDKIVETFKHNPSIEARATAFFIKKDKEKQFVEEFSKNFRDYFILYKSEDFIKTNILGNDTMHNKTREFLGDYFAVAIDKYSFKLSNSKRVFKAQHAGLTKDEMLIPMIMLSKKK
ncbi:MAG: alkaline phosphatase family protein [Sphaerochaetaceae bacterium]|nr:alkaline phosphatase family protein [Sphaerochaetaceae bacterium]